MIIVTYKEGQLCNRLFVFAHLIAYAAERRIHVVNPAFDEYASFFEATYGSYLCSYPAGITPMAPSASTRNRIHKISTEIDLLLAKIERRLPGRAIPWSHWDVLQPVTAINLDNSQIGVHELAFIYGLHIWADECLRKHGDLVRRYFRPRESHCQAVKTIIHNARAGADILVGVHIRQGDFRTFKGGRLFLEAVEYVSYMRQICDLLSPARVRFLICSNERQDALIFSGFNSSWGSGQIVEDLYALAECDYIVGPPSSYSGWAGFYGRKPVCWLRREQVELYLKDLHNHANREPWRPAERRATID